MARRGEVLGSPDGEGERQENKEILRSAVIQEVWVGEPENPGVFVVLAQKDGTGWWELPGGKIEGTPTTPDDFRREAEREWREEISIAAEPKTSLEPFPLPGFDARSTSDITTKDGKRIITHPFIVRQTYETLPSVQAFITKDQVHEHTSYWWLDVSPLYYPGNLKPRQDLTSEFRPPAGAILSFWHAWQDPLHDALRIDGSSKRLRDWGVGTYSARQPEDLSKGIARVIPVSIVSARVLHHYVSPDHALEPPPGMQRPKFKPFRQ